MTVESAKSIPAGAGRQSHPVFWMRQSKSTSSVDAEPGDSAQAIFSEIAAFASHFSATGEEASIDLRCLKAMPEERKILENLLGRGEVSAVVEALGRSEIRETAIPCVWWVRHRDDEDEIVSELIEIAEIPEMLMGDRKAVACGLEALRVAMPIRI